MISLNDFLKVSGVFGMLAFNIFFIFNLSIIIFQQSMKVVCQKYFQHIRKIVQIMQPNLRSKNEQKKIDQRLPFFGNQQNFQRQLYLLKQNIQGLLRYTQKLETQNQVLRRKLNSKQGVILQQNSYSIQQHNPNKKIQNMASNINLEQNNQFKKINSQKSFEGTVLIKDYDKNQKGELKQTRQLYLKSLNKIHELKKQINTLNNQLIHLNKNYDEQIKISENRALKQKDLFVNNNSLCAVDRRVKTQAENYDLQFLLCHEELTLEDHLFKQNDLSGLNTNHKRHVVQSLFSKGISHLDQRPSKKEEHKILDCVYNLYRQESQKLVSRPQLKKSHTVCYR